MTTKKVRAWAIYNAWNDLFISAYFNKKWATEQCASNPLNFRIVRVEIRPIQKKVRRK